MIITTYISQLENHQINEIKNLLIVSLKEYTSDKKELNVLLEEALNSRISDIIDTIDLNDIKTLDI